ncbi:MAG: cobalt-precorrin-5B (C(1))-methyltransferase [Rhodospirillales bacterium]|nr:cobalt-precorrin-5B (C(1))-methyltransferase [Rhodospirillales bacterium]
MCQGAALAEPRKGWTTGACAAAAAKAAATALVRGRFPKRVTIALPKGLTPSFAPTKTRLGKGWAEAGVIKDAGDDPDVTHGALILVRVRKAQPGSGLVWKAGQGVGTVTLPGLPIAVGEPAITPGPRAQIARNLQGLGEDWEITLSIPGGAELAKTTLNGRLGIKGGLSILGTTGVVMPYSNAAWIHSIHRAIDVARAGDLAHIAACTGDASERGVARLHRLPARALIDVGGFMGPLFKYLSSRQGRIARLTLAGGFAKMSKLAQGALDLHSSKAAIDAEFLADCLARLGAAKAVVAKARASESAARILVLAGRHPLALAIAKQAKAVAKAYLPPTTKVDVALFDRAGQLLAHAD